MKDSAAWTKLAPYKEQPHFRSPSDSIGNAYSSAAAHLKLKDMPAPRSARTHDLESEAGVLGRLGRLTALETTRAAARAETQQELAEQPLTPGTQKRTITQEVGGTVEPDTTDLERYAYYCRYGIDAEQIPALKDAFLDVDPSTGEFSPRPMQDNLTRLQAPKLLTQASEGMVSQLIMEAAHDFQSSIKEGIVQVGG